MDGLQHAEATVYGSVSQSACGYCGYNEVHCAPYKSASIDKAIVTLHVPILNNLAL